MKLGTENRKQLIAAGVLGAVLLLVAVYELTSFSSTSASTATPSASNVPAPVAPNSARPAARRNAATGKKRESSAEPRSDPAP